MPEIPSDATATLDLIADPWGTTILLVCPSPGEARWLRGRLDEGGGDPVLVTPVAGLEEALAALAVRDFTAVLLDESMLDDDPERVHDAIERSAPEIPVVVLERAPSAMSLEVVLAKSALDRRSVLASIRQARERKLARGGGASPDGLEPSPRELATADVRVLVQSVQRGGWREALDLVFEPVVDLDGPPALRLAARPTWVLPGVGPVREDGLRERARRVDRGHVLWHAALEAACEQSRRLAERRDLPVQVSLPVPASALADPAGARVVLDALQSHGVPPEAFLLEVSEPLLLRDPERTERWAQALRLAEVPVALVQVGRGASAFELLGSFPASVLEIDRGLAARAHASRRSAAAVRVIVAVAQALGAVAAADGVQTELQARALQELGCRRLRGRLYGPSRPDEAPP